MAARRRGRRIQTAGTGSSTVAPSVAEAVDILQSTEVFGNLFSSDDDGETGKDNIIIILSMFSKPATTHVNPIWRLSVCLGMYSFMQHRYRPEEGVHLEQQGHLMGPTGPMGRTLQ